MNFDLIGDNCGDKDKVKTIIKMMKKRNHNQSNEVQSKNLRNIINVDSIEAE